MGQDSTGQALAEWAAYVDKHLTPPADADVEESFPNLRELRKAREDVQDTLPASVLKLVADKPASIEKKTTPIIGLGDSFRSKRQKVDEFFELTRGNKQVGAPTAFFGKQMAEWYKTFDQGHLGADVDLSSAGGSQRSASVRSTSRRSASVATGASLSEVGSVVGMRQSGTKRKLHDASPMIFTSSASVEREPSMAAVADRAAAVGPLIAQSSSQVSFQKYLKIVDKLLAEMGTRDLKRTMVHLAPVVREFQRQDLGFTRPERYGLDSVRKEFKPEATKEQVTHALKRAKAICLAHVPRALINVDIRPIIIVPSIVNSVITLSNARGFLEDGRWSDPLEARAKRDIGPEGDILHINKPGCPFKEFIVRDTPSTIKSNEWQFVCCVFVSGATWQFDGFYGKSGKDRMEPRDVLSRIPGYNVQYEDEALHPNVLKWNLTSLRVSKTANRRHKDIKTVEDFWRAQMQRMPYIDKFRPYFKTQ